MKCPNCSAEVIGRFCPYCGSEMPKEKDIHRRRRPLSRERYHRLQCTQESQKEWRSFSAFFLVILEYTIFISEKREWDCFISLPSVFSGLDGL